MVCLLRWYSRIKGDHRSNVLLILTVVHPMLYETGSTRANGGLFSRHRVRNIPCLFEDETEFFFVKLIDDIWLPFMLNYIFTVWSDSFWALIIKFYLAMITVFLPNATEKNIFLYLYKCKVSSLLLSYCMQSECIAESSFILGNWLWW